MKTKSKLKSHIGYWINRFRTQIHHTFEMRLQKYDVTVGQWCVLISLYDKEANSVTTLAQYVDVSKPVVSRVVEKLVNKGLILIKEGEDRRSEQIFLTDKGMQLVPILIQESDSIESYFFNCLEQDEIQYLRKILNKLFIQKTPIIPSGWLTQGEKDEPK